MHSRNLWKPPIRRPFCVPPMRPATCRLLQRGPRASPCRGRHPWLPTQQGLTATAFSFRMTAARAGPFCLPLVGAPPPLCTPSACARMPRSSIASSPSAPMVLRCAPRAEVGCRIDDAECGGGRSVPSACLERNGGTAERRPDESGQATEGADHDGRCQPLGPRTARPRCWRDRRATPRRGLLTRRRWRRTVLESGWPALRRAARTASGSGGGGAAALSTSSERGWSAPPERRSRRGSGAGAERCSTVSSDFLTWCADGLPR